MKSIEESVITSMDGSNIEIYPFLSYIVQDIWELGAPPRIIIDLIQKHHQTSSKLKVIDLGCGKGAVSIQIAKELQCTCLGIDAIEDFIKEANKKVKKFQVNHLCTFIKDDIRKRINKIPKFDIIILGAIGTVFGDYYSTLTNLTRCLKQKSIVIIDDSYIEDESDFTHPNMLKKSRILHQIKKAGMELIDEVILNKTEIMKSDTFIFNCIKKRCQELSEKNPDKKEIFQNYIKRQEEENTILETKAVCSTMVIKKRL
jgi:ubiquinone/menaquinone biosynthesis C-methylase UbiE